MRETQAMIDVSLERYRFGIKAKFRFPLWNMEFRNKKMRVVGSEGHFILLE